jgi:TorA maturation chaperone TorD
MMLNAEIAAVLAEDVSTLAILQDSELSPAVLAGLQELTFPDNLGLLPHDDISRRAFTMMREVVTSFPTAPDAAFLDDLAADFAAIYLTGALGASPYESYWLSDDHLICQDAMFDMRTLYAEAGLKVPDWRMRPDDHLVFQLQFLARQLSRAGKDDDWRSLANFLDYHLLRWLPDFASRVVNRCDTPFYAALALLTDVWCRQLRDLIVHHLGEARLTPEDIAESLSLQRKMEIKEVPIHFVPGGAGPSW